MSLPARLLPTSDRPDRAVLALGIGLLLLADLILVAFLRNAPMLLALTAAALVGVAVIGRISWAVALLAVGVPILDPITVVLHEEAVVFYATRVALIAAIAVVFLIHTRRPLELAGRLIGEPAVLWAIGLGVIIWFGSTWTPSPYYAHMKVVYYLVTNLPLLIGGILLASPHDPQDDRADARFDSFLVLVIVFALLIALAGFINLQIRFYRFSTRLNTLGINSIWIARVMGLALFALLSLRGLGKVRTRTVLLAAAPMVAVTILAGARGPTIGIVLVLLLWVTAFKKTSRTRKFLLLGGIVIATALFLIAMPEVLRDRFIRPLRTEASGVERLGIVGLVREAMLSVFGLGLGTGGFSQLMRLGDMRAYPHNIIAEVGIENGLLGLLALGGLCWTALSRGLRARTDPRTLAALLGFIFAFWNAQFSGDLMANEWIWLYAGLIVGRTRTRT
jgi:hypothetical protein